MRMQAEHVTRIEHEGVAFLVAMTFGDQRETHRRLAGMAPTDPEALDIVEEVLLERVRGVEGLEAADGTPITQLTAEVVRALPAQFVMATLERVLAAGQDAGDATFPAPADVRGVGG